MMRCCEGTLDGAAQTARNASNLAARRREDGRQEDRQFARTLAGWVAVLGVLTGVPTLILIGTSEHFHVVVSPGLIAGSLAFFTACFFPLWLALVVWALGQGVGLCRQRILIARAVGAANEEMYGREAPLTAFRAERQPLLRRLNDLRARLNTLPPSP
jgi:hypothetical protein